MKITSLLKLQLWIWFIFPCTVSTTYAMVSVEERQVLIDLYNNTHGVNWTSNAGWTGAQGTECTWHGVSCDVAETHVLAIELPANHLQGTIPVSLHTLTSLQVFNVQTNLLTGPIPSLSGLITLQIFNIGSNSLTGQIPPLTDLTSLNDFLANNNSLTGSIPALAGLTQLGTFAVNDNQLTGPIPPLTDLRSLVQFIVDRNQLTGSIPPLTGLSNLAFLSLSNNQLTGPLPALVDLASLQYLIVDHNELHGQTPAPPNPSSLVSGGSHLCPNPLDPALTAWELIWNEATASTPWYALCDPVFRNDFE